MAAIFTARSGARADLHARGFTRPQIAALWPFGPVTVADHRRDGDMAAIAARILEDAPPRFALAGLSMGGYIAFAMMRQAPERIAKLALLDTSARPDTPEQTAGRKTQIAMAQAGRYGEIPDLSIPRYLHREASARCSAHGHRASDGRRNRAGGLRAPAKGDHVAAGFAAVAGARSAARRWCWSATATSHAAGTQQGNRRRHSRCASLSSCRKAGICPRSRSPMR